MSKKFGRLLIGAAVLGAAAGAGLAYLSKYNKKKENWEDDFEDFEDEFEDDTDEADEDTSSREYVTIPTPAEHDESKLADETAAAAEGETDSAKSAAGEPDETSEPADENFAQSSDEAEAKE